MKYLNAISLLLYVIICYSILNSVPYLMELSLLIILFSALNNIYVFYYTNPKFYIILTDRFVFNFILDLLLTFILVYKGFIVFAFLYCIGMLGRVRILNVFYK